MRSLTIALGFACTLAAAGSATAQAPDYAPPKTSWGVPDLQGVWTNASLTAMERPSTIDKLVISEEEAARLVRQNTYTRVAQQDRQASQVDAESSSRLLADGNTSRAHNSFWLDPGSTYAMVKGERRSSWIIDPPDGRIPYLDPAKARAPRVQVFTDPEIRPQSEQCLMSFTGSAGPVMNNGPYNNNYQIVQTPDAVMILSEMIHEVRIIPINGAHGPAAISRWGGDSIGRYEGATLVVETVNPTPKQRAFITAKGKVTERFTRWSDNQILYEFTVEDPTPYRAPWSGEMTLNASAKPIYEYACHEGNYSLPSILTGARKMERQGRPPLRVIPESYAGIDVSEGQ